MVRPDAPDCFSWICSSVLHLEILVAAALLIGDEVETRVDVDPLVYDGVVYSSFVRQHPFLPAGWEEGVAGHWPMNCGHEALLRLFRKWPEEVLPDTCCAVCRWPWWVIHRMLRD